MKFRQAIKSVFVFLQFKNVNIGKKVVALPIIVLVFLIGVGVTTFLRLAVIEKHIEEMTQNLAPEANAATLLLQNILERNKLVQTYIRTAEEDHIYSYENLRMDFDMIAADALKVSNEDQSLLINKVVADSTLYNEIFLEYIAPEFRLTNKNIATQVDVLGPKIEQLLNDISETAHQDGKNQVASAARAVLKPVLIARVYLQEFMLKHNRVAADRFEMEMLGAEMAIYDLEDVMTDPARIQWALIISESLSKFNDLASKIFESVTNMDDKMYGDLAKSSLAVVNSATRLREEVWVELNALGSETAEKITSTHTLIVIVTTSATLIGVVLAILLTISIKRGLATLNQTIVKVQQTGDLSLRVDLDSNDEVGLTAKAFNQLMSAQMAAVSDINDVMGALANGDFSQRVSVELKGDLATLKDATNSSLVSIEETMTVFSCIVSALENGDFVQRMEGDFKGLFATIQDNTNNALEGLEKAIQEFASVMQAVEGGKFNRRMEGSFQGAFAEIQVSTNEALSALELAIKEINEIMGQVANNNLSNKLDIEVKGDLDELKNAINQSLDVLNVLLSRITRDSTQVAAASTQSSEAIGQISDGAQNQLHSISQVASSIAEANTSTNSVAEETSLASTNSQESVDLVESGQEKVDQMVKVVKVITNNSDKINQITEVIGTIATQTKLLSLNAAIEAAHAGEHGSGFAVVADEVRKLAEHSSNSAREINKLATEAMREAKNATQTASEVSDDMVNINSSITSNNKMLEKIAVAMEELSRTSNEIEDNMKSMRKIAESNAVASEEMTATAVEVSSLAGSVSTQVGKFSLVEEEN